MTVLVPAWSPNSSLLLLLLLLSPCLRGTPDCYFSHSPISSDFQRTISELTDYLLKDYPVTVAINLQDENHCKALWSLFLAHRWIEQLKAVAGSKMQKLLEAVNTEIHFVTSCTFQPLPECLRFVQTNISHLLQDTCAQLSALKPCIGKACQNFSRCLEVQCQPGNRAPEPSTLGPPGRWAPSPHPAHCVPRGFCSHQLGLKTCSSSLSFSSFLKRFIFMCECYSYLHARSALNVRPVPRRGQKRASDPLDVGSQLPCEPAVGAGPRSQARAASVLTC